MRLLIPGRKILSLWVFLCLLLTAPDISASHFRFGTITWQKAPGSTNEVIFKIALAYRATYETFVPAPTLGGTVVVGDLNFGDGSPLVKNLAIQVSTLNTSEDWFYGEATIRHTYPVKATPTDYEVSFSQCCRILTLQNLANKNSTGYKVTTTVNIGTSNNSPVSTISPIVNLQTGLADANFLLPASDPDGDPLTFRLATQDEMNNIQPTGISVDPASGRVSFNTVGKKVGNLYATQIIISDNKGAHIAADFIIRIVATSNPPYFDYTVTPANGNILQVRPGQLVNFTVVAKDIDVGSIVDLTAVGLPLGSVVNPVLPATGNPASLVFSWTPADNQLGSAIINFTATDNNGVQAHTSVSILVSLKPHFDIPPTPSGTSLIIVQPDNLLTFDVQASDFDPTDAVSIVAVGIHDHAPSGESGHGYSTKIHSSFPVGLTLTPALPTVKANPTTSKVNWTPVTSDWGIHPVAFTAEDNYGEQAIHELNILVNTTPVFASTPVTSVKEGQTYSYLIKGFDPDVAFGDVLEIVPAYGLPSWLTLIDNEDGTALLTGTPTSANVGTYTIGIDLMDINHHSNIGGMPTQLFDINVIPCDLSAAATASNVSCAGFSDGYVDLSVSGGTAPYTFVWSNGTTIEDISEVSTGVYSVTVTDVYGCKATDTISVSQPEGLAINASVKSNVGCPSGNDGAAEAVIQGGTAPYNILWSNGLNTSLISSLTAGEYSVSVTDLNGCNASASLIIPQVDTIAPVAVAKNATLYLDDAGNATLLAETVNNGSYDNCSVTSLWIDNTSFNCGNLGQNTITLSVADASGRLSSATAIVTVADTIAPVALVKNTTVYLDATGKATINPQDVNAGSFDNCSVATLSVFPTTFDCSRLGNNTVTLTVTDNSGLYSTATAIVTVADTISPVAIAKNLEIYLDASGSATIIANAVNNGSFDNCSVAAFSLDKTSFNCSNLGDNGVVLTVTDISGKKSSALAFVKVTDRTAPVAITKNIIVYLDASGKATITAADINNGSSDNCSIVSYTLDKTLFNASNLGPNNVVLTVKDQGGLIASSPAVVTIADNTAPVAITKNTTVYLDANGNATITPNDVDNGSYDNTGIATKTVSSTNFNCSNTGNNTVTLTVTDIAGNIASGKAIVTVVDNTAPVVVTKNISVQLDATGKAVITSASVNNGSKDNCSIASLSLDKALFTCANIGSNVVTLTATDASGNKSSKTAIVTVTGNTAILNVSLSSPAVIGNYTTSCNEKGDGTINLLVSGGQSPYQINWSNGTSGATTLSNLFAGTYSVTVSDANGCSKSNSIALNRPENCDCITAPAVAPAYACNRTIDGSSNVTINGETACINSSFSGNVNFFSGTLVIKGNAIITNLSLGANCTLVVLGTLKSDYINLNASSSQIINYGRVDVTQNVSPSGQLTNYSVFNISNIYNLNSEGRLINKGTFFVKNSINNNGKIENYSVLQAGIVANNSGASLINKCSVRSGAFNVNSGSVFTNNGTVANTGQSILNSIAINVTSGSIIKTNDLSAGSATITDAQTGCALIQVYNKSVLNNTTLSGPVSLCDSYNGIETSSNTSLVNGAKLSCTSCAYKGGLSSSTKMDFDDEEPALETASSILSVYPNPAGRTEVKITVNGNDFTYKVYSFNGAIVFQNVSSQGVATMNVNGWKAGLYVVEVADGSGNRYFEKLVVE